MANPQLIKVPRQTDRALVESFIAFADALEVAQATINVGAAGTFSIPTKEELPSEVAELVSFDASLIESASVSIQGFGITFYRGGYPTQNQPGSAIYDDIGIQFDKNNCKLSEHDRLRVFGLISKRLGPFNPLRHVEGGRSPEQDQLLAIHNATLERLESLNEELIRGSEEFRRTLEEDFRERSNELEQKFEARSDQLNAEIDAKRSLIAAQEKELAGKVKEIDDRQNTHVRRELRQQILAEIRNRTKEFRLTKGTNNLRWPIHVVLVALIFGLALAAFYYAVESIAAISENPARALAVAVLVSKQLLLSAALGASVIFYIKWMNAWFSKHAATEFQLRQFQLDIERASWVVETALEWKDAKGSTIPPELLNPISNNLFGSEDVPRTLVSPADELASALMGTASRVRLNVAGSELELDAKKLKKAGSDGA